MELKALGKINLGLDVLADAERTVITMCGW